VRNDHGYPNPKQVSVKILAYVDMIIQHCYSLKRSIRRETCQASRWSPPPHGIVLVNLDAALFANRRRMAMGVVLQDCTGRCLGATSLPLQGFTSPEIAKALALRGAVQMVSDKGFDKAIFFCLRLLIGDPTYQLSDSGSLPGWIADQRHRDFGCGLLICNILACSSFYE
jgi:hypothetical protein